ncbi:hypothetical protein, partial [Paenibacillus xylanexedens]|uniref:hypothetical protein n=1 Tax=Paenibacillus xylanexedens TaxID=528191 RepID=UPI001C92DF79
MFVKEYWKIRYGRGLDGVREGLKYEDVMDVDGIGCEGVYSLKSEYIDSTFSGEDYMICGFRRGNLIKAG